MNTRHGLQMICLTIAALGSPLLAHAAKGSLMSITSTMKMSGSPMPMPPRTITHQQCVAGPDAFTDPSTWGSHSKCTTRDVRRTDNEVDAHLMCAGGAADLHVQMLPGGGAHGTMHMVTYAHGMNMTIDQSFDAKRIGDCDVPSAQAAH